MKFSFKRSFLSLLLSFGLVFSLFGIESEARLMRPIDSDLLIDDHIARSDTDPYITGTLFSFGSNGGTQYGSVYNCSNASATVTSGGSWMYVTMSNRSRFDDSGTGHDFTIHVSPNYLNKARSGHIRVKADSKIFIISVYETAKTSSGTTTPNKPVEVPYYKCNLSDNQVINVASDAVSYSFQVESTQKPTASVSGVNGASINFVST